LKQIFRLLKKDIIRFWVDRPAVALTFILPAILIIIFGNIFGGNGGSQGKISVILVKESNAPIAELIENKLDSSSTIRLVKVYTNKETGTSEAITEDKAKEFVENGKISTAIVLPQDCFTDTSSSVKIRIYYDPKNEIEFAMVQGEIQRTIMTQIPKIIPVLLQRKVQKELGIDKSDDFKREIATTVSRYWGIPEDSVLKITDLSSITSSDVGSSASLFNSLISIDQKQLVGKDVKNPGVTRTAGGWAMMFLLFTIVGAASSLFEEKQEGTLKRLLCMPVKSSHILWSKFIYSIVLGVIQLMVLFGVAWLLFDLDIFSNFWNLLIIMIASAMAANSFGMIITSFATSMNQANGVATLLILIMSAIGGAWFPIALLPDWMQTLSKFTIVYWSVEGFLSVLWRNGGFEAIAVNVLILVCISIVLNFYSIVRIRNGKIFN